MKLLLFILCFCCLTNYSHSQDNFEQNVTPSGYYFDEDFFFVMRIKNDSLKEVEAYKKWREDNPAIPCINSLFGSFKNWGSTRYSTPPKVITTSPKIPMNLQKERLKRLLYVQFSVDTAGIVSAAELIHFFKGNQIDSIDNRILKLDKKYSWKKVELTEEDKDFIKESLIAVTSWKCEPGLANGRKVACIGKVPIKLDF